MNIAITVLIASTVLIARTVLITRTLLIASTVLIANTVLRLCEFNCAKNKVIGVLIVSTVINITVLIVQC